MTAETEKLFTSLIKESNMAVAIDLTETQETSIDEISERHKGDWVAVRVTERDEAGQPLKAIVVAHNKDRNRLRDEIPPGEVCIFYAGPVPHEGYDAIIGNILRELRP